MRTMIFDNARVLRHEYPQHLRRNRAMHIDISRAEAALGPARRAEEARLTPFQKMPPEMSALLPWRVQ